MSTLTLRSSFSKNSDLVMSAQELRRNYLYGITVSSPFANRLNLNFSDEDIEFHIRDAQKQIENFLAVKLKRQIYSERLQFDNDEWRYWGYIKTSLMVVCPLQLDGFLNTTNLAQYPLEWLSSKQESGDELYQRQIYMVPAGNSGAITNSVIFAGILPNLGYMNAGRIPNYWNVTYVTGFAKIPYDVMSAIGQMATISMLYIAGVNVLGYPGLQSSSLSIDGLSQTVSTQLNSFGSRIKGMSDDLQHRLPYLRDTYRGINFISM